MPKAGKSTPSWDEPELLLENDHFEFTDLRAMGSIKLNSIANALSITLPYEEWDEFVQAVDTLSHGETYEGEYCLADVQEFDAAVMATFSLMLDSHAVTFGVIGESWPALQEAVGTLADYPWAEPVMKVDEAEMRETVAKQRRWLMKQSRGERRG